jgi:hypothetical protein
LLREYVRAVIVESEGGGEGGGEYGHGPGSGYGDLYAVNMGMNPYGANFGSYGDLYNVFVKPFVDVVDTAVGKTKELSQKAQTLVKVAFETVATTLIPVFSDSYKEIFAKEKKHMDAIKKEYKAVYQSNFDAFRDNDVFWTAFCYAPAAVMTLALVRRTPGKARRIISALSGGTLDPWLTRVFTRFEPTRDPPHTGLDYKGSEPSFGGGGGGYGGDMGPMEGVIREDDDKKKKRKSSKDLAQVLTDRRVIERLQQSPVTAGLQQATQTAVKETLASVYEQAQAVMHSKTLQELQQKTGKQAKGAEKLAQLPPAEKQKAEQAILATLRKAMKEFYAQNLEAQVKKAQEAGVPDDSPYVQAYNDVISKVKAL